MISRNRLANRVPALLALLFALQQGTAPGQSAPDALGVMPNNVGVYLSDSTTASVSSLDGADTDAAKDGEFVQSTAGKYWFKRKVPSSPAGASPLDEVDLFLKNVQGQWDYISTLLPPPAAGGASGFGTCVVSRGSRVFVGAPGALNGSSIASGVVYVYDLNGTNLTLVQAIEPPNGMAGDRFGEAISVHGSRLIVGSPGREKSDSGNVTNDAGAAFLYEEGANWQLVRTEWSTVAQDGGQFGFSVSLNGRVLAIGAPYEDGWFFVGNDVYVMGDTGTVHIGRWDRPGELLGFYNLFSLFQPVQDKILGLGGSHFGWSVAVDDRMRIAVSMPDSSWTAADGMSGWDSGLVMTMYWNGRMNPDYSFQIHGFWKDGLSAAARFGEYVETSDGAHDFGIQCAQRVDNAPVHWFAKTTVQAQPGSLVNGVETPFSFGAVTGMDPEEDALNFWEPKFSGMHGSYFEVGANGDLSAKSTLSHVVDGFQFLSLKADDGSGGLLEKSLTLEVVNGALDADGDGMSDAWEQQYFSGTSQTAIGDYDNDGASNLQEYQKGLLPNDTDTDNDGMTDGDEVSNGLDALVDDRFEDKDGDRYPNIFELKNGASPSISSSAPTPHYVVNPAGGGTHTTIQSAISAASADYKIIQVAAGLYQGSSNTGLSIGSRKLLLISAQGASKTILDAQSARRVIYVNGDSVIDGFTVKNGATTDGAGIYCASGKSRFVNCVLLNNKATGKGGAFYVYSGSPSFVHCTAAGNSAATGGHGIYAAGGTTTVANSILWDSIAFEIANGASGTVTVSYSTVCGGYSGTGNSNVDPLLIADGHLRAGSPAINAADPASPTKAEMDGEVRPVAARADMGADEWLDSDGDNLADWWELARFGGWAQTAAGDPDTDSLSNANEYGFGSDPLVANADNDLADDGKEFAAGSNPFVADTDADGMLDGYEIDNGLNPLDPRDPLEDKDGDRVPNLYESQRGTLAGTNSSTPEMDFTVNPAITTETATVKKTIAAAITAANNAPGDYKTIFIKRATYPESSLSISSKRLALIGERGQTSLPEISSPSTAAGIYISYPGVVLDSLVIKHSNPLSSGRGVYVSASGAFPQIRLANCIITGNAEISGSGIYVGSADCLIDHCTIFGNTEPLAANPAVPVAGLGLCLSSSSGKARVRNSIVWNPARVSGSTQISNTSGAAIELSGSIVQNGELGVSGVDPLLDRWGCLRAGSPAINFAGVSSIPGMSQDIHGEVRAAQPDCGADEFVDADGDSLPDWWELKFIGNMNANGTANPDNDGLTHLQEHAFGSNPVVADTDADSANDGAESTAGTDPWDMDSDDDGIKDGYEILKLLNPLDYRDALEDKDGDRIPNLYEAVLNTDANGSSSVPAAHYTVAAGGGTHTTIEAAITAANAAAGDCRIILVKKKTYAEGNLTLGSKRIMLMGEQNAAPPTISTATASPCLRLTFSGCVVDGLNLTHSSATNSDRGIYAYMSGFRAQSRVVNCVITENRSDSGAGIYLGAGELLVDHSTLFRNRNNTFDGEGGEGRGIYVSSSSKLRLRNSIVWNPTTASGSAQIYKSSSTSAVVELANSIVLGGEFGGLATDPLLDRYGFLKAGSPAINPSGGVPIPVSTKDMLGNTRTFPHDLGAAEYLDADNDGLPDWWELRFIGNTTGNGASNPDSDGLTHALEYAFGSNPAVADTDADGANDGAENAAGTDPWDTDSDDDGMIDGYEITHSLAPLNRRDALEDKDGDRIPNLYEAVRGTLASIGTSKPTADYTVAATGGTHTTIAAAISSANSAAGDCKIILVKKGTYTEPSLNLSGKRIILLGEQGVSPPVLAAPNTSNTIMLSSDGAALDGLVIKHAVPELGGIGINVSLPNVYSQARLANCILRENFANNGASVFIHYGDVVVDHCSIVRNQGTLTSGEGNELGLGVYISNGSLRLRNSIVWNPVSDPASTQIHKSTSANCEVVNSIVLGGEYGGINADPKLTRNDKLRPGSPAVNPSGGVSLSTSSTDIEGEIRTNPPDIGADEFVDSDADGMADSWETQYFTNLTKTATGDDDLPAADGLKNLYEYLFELDPTKPDTDGDGLSDLLEAFPQANTYYTLPAETADDDSDGLSNAQETMLGTNVTVADSNGDGILDGVSWMLGFNPLSTDSDGDGLSNALELAQGTSPLATDSDGDGVSDSLDKFPLDPSQSTLVAVGGDVLAPAVTLTKPPGAVLQP